MPHIDIDATIPGIRSLVLFRPETGRPLYELAQILLRGPSSLSEAERELIAAWVSHRNCCDFCARSHAAAARCLYGNDGGIVDAVLVDMQNAGISELLKGLLAIADRVRVSGKNALPEDIQRARDLGADDRMIHDTVLIAAAFSMFNRYVDGLASFTPPDHEVYSEMGKRMVQGYVLPQSKEAGD